MASWSADRELELACKVGSLENLDRALGEGADPNWDGGAPLFLAIMSGSRPLVERLIEAGADPTPFLGAAQRRKAKTVGARVDLLMLGSPPPVEDQEAPPPPVDED